MVEKNFFEKACYEKNLSTQQKKATNFMWISQENENCRRASGPQSQTSCRTEALKRLTFPKASRLLTKHHYQRLYKFGRRFTGKLVTIDFKNGNASIPKLGITISKKFGKAHDRNRFKRVVREAFRISADLLPRSIEINISPRFPVPMITRSDILSDLNLFNQAHLLDPVHVKS